MFIGRIAELIYGHVDVLYHWSGSSWKRPLPIMETPVWLSLLTCNVLFFLFRRRRTISSSCRTITPQRTCSESPETLARSSSYCYISLAHLLHGQHRSSLENSYLSCWLLERSSLHLYLSPPQIWKRSSKSYLFSPLSWWWWPIFLCIFHQPQNHNTTHSLYPIISIASLRSWLFRMTSSLPYW